MKSKSTTIQILVCITGAFVLGLLVAGSAAQESLKRILNPPELEDSLQYGYSQVTITAPNASLVHVARQVGISEDGSNDFESQVNRSFDALLAALDVADTNAKNVVKITLLIVAHDAEKLAYLVEKHKAVFGDSLPASTLILVSALHAPGILFEIDAIAVAPV